MTGMKTAAKHAALALATLASVIGMSANLRPAVACSADSYMGSVCMMAANFCPRGFYVANGQLLSIGGQSALYSLTGCLWGGDCRTSFAMPDLRGRSPAGAGTGPGLTELELGSHRGSEYHTQTVSELAPHSHTALFSPSGQGGVGVSVFTGAGASAEPSLNNNYLQAVGNAFGSVNPDIRIYGDGAGSPIPLGGVSYQADTGVVTVLSTGAAAAMPIQGPVVSLTFCVSSDGLYPPRS